MREALIVVRQVMIMFILIGVGWFMGKRKVLKPEAVSSMNALVVYVASPAIMIQAFDVAFSAEKVLHLGISIILSILVMLLAMAAARLVFGNQDGVSQFASIFNNAGFIGIPLVQAVLGEEAIFYLTIYMAVWNLLAWTYGFSLLTGKPVQPDWKKILVNPAIAAVFLGLLLFLLPIRLPSILNLVLSSAGGMNTPLAMIILGFAMTRIQWKENLQDLSIWKTSLVRLVLIPLLTVAVLSFMPKSINEIRMTLMTVACTPVGAMLTMFQGMLGQDPRRSSILVSVTTLLSMFTIPLILSAASILWGI